MSHLLVNGLRVRGRVGCKEAERAHPQMLRFDFRIDYDMRPAIERDELSLAIDYKSIAQSMRELLAAREWRLVETLAHDAAVHVRGLNASISRIEVAVTKDVITDAASVTAVVALNTAASASVR
jgi:FolB domain-containing protein